MTKQVGNSELMRELNTSKILNAMAKSHPISQSELAQATGLSFPTVNRIISGLRRKEFIVEDSHAESKGGRRPKLLRINPEANYVIGIDVDITETLIGLLNLDGEIKSSEVFLTQPELGPDFLTDELNRRIQKMILEKCPDKSKIIGIGIALPGNVEPVKGMLVYSANLKWKDVPLKEMMYNKTGIETIIEGDAAAMALGEHLFGNARKVDSLAWVNVAGGVGVGLIYRGTIYRGKHGSAGEVGHITVLKDGPLCFCGKKGCLETMVGTTAVLSRVAKTIREGKETLISDLVHSKLEYLRIPHLFHAAKEGDGFANTIVKEMAYYLGIGLSMIDNLLDTGLIVIGGSVIDVGGDRFFDMVRQFTTEDIMPERSNRLDIERSALGEKVGVLGAASLIYEEMFLKTI